MRVASSTIRSVLAGVFLLLFAFGITPKLTLHNLVATHEEGRSRDALPDPFSTQLSKANFNCQCDNLIIESPFVSNTSVSSIPVETVFFDYADYIEGRTYSSQVYCSCLRGPPVC